MHWNSNPDSNRNNNRDKSRSDKAMAEDEIEMVPKTELGVKMCTARESIPGNREYVVEEGQYGNLEVKDVHERRA